MWGKDGYTGWTLPHPLHLVEKVTPPLGKSLAQPQYITIIVKNLWPEEQCIRKKHVLN